MNSHFVHYRIGHFQKLLAVKKIWFIYAERKVTARRKQTGWTRSRSYTAIKGMAVALNSNSLA